MATQEIPSAWKNKALEKHDREARIAGIGNAPLLRRRGKLPKEDSAKRTHCSAYGYWTPVRCACTFSSWSKAPATSRIRGVDSPFLISASEASLERQTGWRPYPFLSIWCSLWHPVAPQQGVNRARIPENRTQAWRPMRGFRTQEVVMRSMLAATPGSLATRKPLVRLPTPLTAPTCKLIRITVEPAAISALPVRHASRASALAQATHRIRTRVPRPAHPRCVRTSAPTPPTVEGAAMFVRSVQGRLPALAGTAS
jgi:hypothetical protein